MEDLAGKIQLMQLDKAQKVHKNSQTHDDK